MQETMHLSDSRRESFVSELREWLETASASNNPAGLNAMATLIFERLSRVGMSPTLVEHPAGNAVLESSMGRILQPDHCCCEDITIQSTPTASLPLPFAEKETASTGQAALI
jgi:hypothetical protein